MNVNKVILVGRLTRDPEVKALPSGQQVASFSIATGEKYTDKTTNKVVEKTEFHNVVAWGKTAENIGRYMFKGSQMYIEGKLQTRSWEADGKKHYRTEIIAHTVQFGAKPQGQRQPLDDEFDTANSGGNSPEPHSPPPASHYGDDDEINPEDIPF